MAGYVARIERLRHDLNLYQKSGRNRRRWEDVNETELRGTRCGLVSSELSGFL